MVNHFNILACVANFKEKDRAQQLPLNVFQCKYGKHEKYRLLLTFNDLLKNNRNVVLTYNSTCLKEVDSC